MNLLLLNIVLAVLWMMMWEAFDIYSLIAGFLLGYLLLGIISRTMEGQGYGTKGWQLVSFGIYFVRVLIQSNIQVAKEILTPGLQMTPRFVRYPVDGLSDVQLTCLANAITLTPGTLSVDISDDNKYLYLHCMYAQDRQSAIAGIDELRDRMMKEMFSWPH